MPQHANAVIFLTVIFLCTEWSCYVIFIAHTLRKILSTAFSGTAHQKCNEPFKYFGLEKCKKV